MENNNEKKNQIFSNLLPDEDYEKRMEELKEKGEKRSRRKKVYSAIGIFLILFFAAAAIFGSFYFWKEVAQIFN